MRLGDKPEQNVEVIPTGSLALDLALGIGGLPKGRIVEIYGPESSGKTTLALHVVANAQKNGGVAAFIDAEHALIRSMPGIWVSTPIPLIVSQPDNGEQALEIADMLIRSGALDVIVIDSVAALVPKAEIEGDMGDSHVGLQARLMSQALRKMTGALAQAGTTAIFINQLREKIGVFFGNPETTTGGKALKFYASVRSGYPPHPDHQERRGGRGQPHQGQGRQEQDGSAVQVRRVRCAVWRGHLQGGIRPGHGIAVQRGQEVRLMVHV